MKPKVVADQITRVLNVLIKVAYFGAPPEKLQLDRVKPE